MEKLAGKTAVITGGNSGIGLATAHEFVALGARVIITGRNRKALDEAVAQLGKNAFGIVSDVGNMQQIRQLNQQVKAIVPSIDIVFINAGIGKFNQVGNMTEEMFDEIMDINFKGSYFTLQQLLPLINDGGSIILNASINAHIGMIGASVYSASKAAILSLAKNLSAELLPRKIRVNAISPGPVGTPLHSSEKLGINTEQLKTMDEETVKLVPLGRYGTAEEIAKIVAFFASDDSSFILGAELIADGGMSTL
jgi:NAD(P)-dependent dehydrogenase (short-subunit alcohol dehydrogenase family)